MLNRLLDDSFDKEIRRNITAVTVARLVANAAYRFAPLFLATIARGFDVSLSTLGFAIFVSELSGFASPFAGRIVDRLTHRNSMVLGLIGSAVGCTIAAVSTSPLMFAVGVTVLALTKQSFDLGLGAWIADHVPYNQRGKIVGLTATAASDFEIISNTQGQGRLQEPPQATQHSEQHADRHHETGQGDGTRAASYRESTSQADLDTHTQFFLRGLPCWCNLEL